MRFIKAVLHKQKTTMVLIRGVDTKFHNIFIFKSMPIKYIFMSMLAEG